MLVYTVNKKSCLQFTGRDTGRQGGLEPPRFSNWRGTAPPPTLQRRQLYTRVGDSQYHVKNVALCKLSNSCKFNLHLLINSTYKVFLTEPPPHFLSGVSASVVIQNIVVFALIIPVLVLVSIFRLGKIRRARSIVSFSCPLKAKTQERRLCVADPFHHSASLHTCEAQSSRKSRACVVLAR